MIQDARFLTLDQIALLDPKQYARYIRTSKPNCFLRRCIHYIGLDKPNGKETEVNVCTAFPTGIPDDIAYGNNLHILPAPGDHGIQFESEI